ncbi:hypothetical protein [Sphingomonas cavernae]|uniref:Uncharacterized protein n=1 Tax=Sphingomonas cavernae TaxID=2320861 RepID=A0A418WRT7_9SPHN|nr:hypothetical protein [Sphingomonas cavernae]RJF93964.1 hypothetical protein D3876_06750 [Sphingomonas cavernae]
MNAQATQAAPSRRLGRTLLAIGVGLLINFVVALGLDQLFHELDVYPPWGEPMNEPGDNALALSYRVVIAVVSCYVAGRLAPWAPMRHAMILGGIGFVLSSLGAVAAANMDLGPLWYPIALVAVTLPCAWVGGVLARRAVDSGERS